MLERLKRYRIVPILLAAAVLAIAWRWSLLGDWLSVERLRQWGGVLRNHELAPIFVTAAYMVASSLMVPVNLLVLVTALTFGTWTGLAYAFLGSLTAAAFTFWLGRMLGQETVRRFSASWIRDLSQKLRREGVLAMATIRLLPLAPFGIVNMMAGASEVRFRDFALGSVIGMTPGIVATVAFENRLERAIRDPGPISIALLLAVMGIIGVAFYGLRRWLSDED